MSASHFSADRPTTVAQLLDAYQRRHAKGLLSEAARAQRDRILRLFGSELGETAAAECGPAQLAKFIAARARWKSPSSKRAASDEINKVFRWAAEERLLDANPFRPVERGRDRPLPTAPAAELGSVAADTVSDVVGLYLRHAGASEHPDAWATKRRNLTSFAADYGSLPLSAAKRHHLLLWVDSRDGWVSDWTRRRGAGEVKAAFGWAARMGIIETNPFAGASLPRGGRRRPTERADFQAMLRNTTPVFRRVLIFLRFAGCRPAEMAAARWEHLDRGRACITLPRHKTVKSTGAPRLIMLHPILVKLVDWVRRHRPHPQYILVNKIGRPWTKDALCCRIRDLRYAGLIPSGVSLYGLRHRFCTEAILQGVDIATVGALAGHSQISTTAYYLHVAGKTDHLRQAVERVFDKPGRGPKGGAL